MTKMFEFHVLRNYPLSNPNRGSDGKPKNFTFGGGRRAYISSQSQNKVFRDKMRSDETLASLCGTRTRQLPALLAKQLSPKFNGRSNAVATQLSALFNKNGENKKESETNQILFINNPLIESLVQRAVKLSEEFPAEFEAWVDPGRIFEDKVKAEFLASDTSATDKDAEEFLKKVYAVTENKVEIPGMSKLDKNDETSVEELVKSLLAYQKDDEAGYAKLKSPKKIKKKAELSKAFKAILEEPVTVVSVDMLLFGRMSTSEIVQGVDAHFGTAHAMGVTPYEQVNDLVVTCDDLTTGQGAGFMSEGSRVLHSSMMYHHHWLEVERLNKAYDLTAEVRGALVSTIFDSLCYESPKALSMKSDSRSLPVGILVLAHEAGSHGNLSLANAFIKPAMNQKMGVDEEVCKMLSDHYSKIRRDIGEHRAYWYSLNDSVPADATKFGSVTDMREVLARIG